MRNQKLNKADAGAQHNDMSLKNKKPDSQGSNHSKANQEPQQSAPSKKDSS